MDVADRGPAASQGAALAARPCPHQADRPDQGARRAGRRRGLHLGGRAQAAGSAPRCTKTIWSIPTTPAARRCRALRRPAHRRRRRRERGRRRGRLPRARGRVRNPAGGLRSGGGDGARRAAAARQGRGRRTADNIFCNLQGEIGDVAKGFARSRRRPRADLFHDARAARPSRDARLDRLEGRRRPLARAHQLAGAVRRPEEARLPHGHSRPRPARLHRAGRRRLRRQAGDGLRGPRRCSPP